MPRETENTDLSFPILKANWISTDFSVVSVALYRRKHDEMSKPSVFGGSLSVIVSVAVFVPRVAPLVALERVRLTVSEFS